MSMAEHYEHMDQKIRQKFENFEPEPPVQVWDNVRTRISETPPPSSPGIIMPIIIAVSLLVFLSGLFYHLISENNDDILIAEPGATYLNSAGTIPTGSTTISDPALHSIAYNTPAEPVVSTPPATKDPGNGSNNTKQIPVRAPFSKPASPGKTGKPALSGNIQDIPSGNSGAWKPGLRQAIASGEIRYSDAVQYDLSMRDIRKFNRFSHRTQKSRAEWSLALAFHPEVTSFRANGENIGKSTSYGISVLPQVSFNRFFIQSGLSIRSTSDEGNYSVAFNRHLGTYEDVYLVTFDSTENGVIPTYHTQTVDVYDTVDHYLISETKARYTYLEIPVLAGYRFDLGRVSFFAKGGPTASFLVAKSVPGAENPEQDARIVNVDYQIPARTTVNWQLQIGAGIDYRLSDKVSFGLEPTLRVGLKPEYSLENGSPARGLSYGLRAGLKYNF